MYDISQAATPHERKTHSMSDLGILTNGYEINEVISSEETELLRGLLKLYRSEKQPRWMENFLEHWAFRGGEHCDQPVELEDAAFHLIESYNQSTLDEGIGGILARYGGKDTLREISEMEFDHLAKYLVLARSHDWMALFIRTEIEHYAYCNGRSTPAEVVKRLVGEMEQFNIQVDIAEQMLRKYPELFREEIAKLATNETTTAATVPPVPEQKEEFVPAQIVDDPPQKQRRKARKTGKKAA